ncbi:RNA-directed DNA polymerase, eukaryota [Tanacetum coccineum]
MIILKNKLKNLKHRLKSWSSGKKQLHNQERKHLQDSLFDIDFRLDQGVGLTDDILNRSKIARDLDDMNKKDSIDLAQKAKVKWAIEGDENSKFFHGIVNKKRRYLAIKGILKDGEWIDNPTRVKAEFYHHFSNRFSQPDWTRVPLAEHFPRCLSEDLSCDLEAEVNSDEIKKAVWECGSDKSPGPDGFTFEFFKKYWSIVGNDVILAVKEFFSSGFIPNGCNPSFIALIPKVLDAKHLNDFRPISLVGCQYKIIGKILASRLSNVMDEIISQEQSAFVKGRQIMDGPIILNESLRLG